jgi:sucrose-6F-phosphate phosphohydrolase
VASDIDGTLLGNEAAAERFRCAWNGLGSRERPLLIYNSGRPADDILALVDAKLLPVPDYVIGGVGTTIVDARRRARVEAFVVELGQPFDQAALAAVMNTIEGIAPQAAVDQHSHKSSWCLPDAEEERIRAIAARLAGAELDVKLVYSSKRDLDILPHAGGKGGALAWICRELAVGLDEVIVAGDTGNDQEMFELPHVRGILVANALAELRQAISNDRRHFLARSSHADGVLEGLRHWGVI